jgi:translation initiation factor 2 beta subunit (eIF-2beta)/eIF-5
MTDFVNPIYNSLKMETDTIQKNTGEEKSNIYYSLLKEYFDEQLNEEKNNSSSLNEKISKPNLSFNIHKRTEWKNFRDNLMEFCKEELFLKIKSNLLQFVKEDTNKLFQLVDTINNSNKTENKKVNDLLDKKIIQIVNIKINKIFGKRKNELIEEKEFNKLVYPNTEINESINIIYQKLLNYIGDSSIITPLDNIVNEILTKKEVELLKYFEIEYKRTPSINKENHFLIQGNWIKNTPQMKNTIIKYMQTFVQCSACSSIRTVIIKNYFMGVDHLSCSDCNSKIPIKKM